MSSQVKLLITNNAFCIVQRATAQSKTGSFRDIGVPFYDVGLFYTLCYFLISFRTSFGSAYLQNQNSERINSSRRLVIAMLNGLKEAS
jgi:hypothetical protein